MTSSKACVVKNPVASNTATLFVTENMVASIQIAPSFDSTICLGDEVWFDATVSNAGLSPVYEWLVNGQVAGVGGSTFSTDQLLDGDVVVCQLQSSENCVVENPVLSNTVQVAVDVCGATEGVEKKPRLGFNVSPNPSSGKIIVEFFESKAIFAVKLVDAQGQIVLASLENHTNFPFKYELDLSGLPKGVYLLQIMSGTQLGVQKLVLH
jgi:hypothetical protein